MMLLHAMHHPGGLTAGTQWLTDAGAAISIGVFAGAYAGGTRAAWRHAGHGRGVLRWQAWCFAGGVAVLLVALVSPLDAVADQLFSAHMAQHVLLAVVAPPLIVAGAPLTAMLWLLPAENRRRLAQWIKRLGWPRTLWAVMTAPVVAWAVHAVAMWIWHLPRLYTLALEHSLIHAAEHVSFVGTAALMWWGFVYPRRSRRAAYGLGVAALFLTMMHSGALGALLTLSKRIWFPVHAAGEAAWGLAPLEDQQLAGLIMWVPGGLLYMAAMSVLFLAWMQRGERREATAPARANGIADTRSARCEIPV
jgi:cytochrome c oxidase assembly factor CtaG